MMLERLSNRPSMVPAAILLASLAMFGGALAFQYIGGMAPCTLCIYQRIPYGVTIALAVLALLLSRQLSPQVLAFVVALCGLVFAAGATVAAFHVGVEQHWWAGLSSCSSNIDPNLSLAELKAQILAAPVVRCDDIAWSMFGISMAGYNFLASVVFAIASFVLVRNLMGSRHVAIA
ncbi:MAG: disulfide bond formation protein B [Alphaproteobacteria bacterium]